MPGERVFYGYLRDLTARNVAEAALHRLADEQAALRRVATAVAAESDPSRLFALVSEEVGKLLEAQTAHTVRFDGDARGGTIVGGWATRPSTCCRSARGCRCDGDTAAAACGGRARAARMDNYERAEGELAASCAATACRRWSPRRCSSAGALWGAVIVLDHGAGAFPEDAEQRIAYFAELAAQALANAQAREELGRVARPHRPGGRRGAPAAGAQPARRRAAAARVAGADAAAGGAPASRRRGLETAGEELTHALQELRELARGIHPAVLTERGLEPAVRALADRAPVPVELTVELEERLPGPAEAAAYYVVSEALTNVAKYADASHVRVPHRRADGGAAHRGRRRRRGRRQRRTAAPACAASPTASRRSAAASRSTARSAPAPPSAPIPLEHPGLSDALGCLGIRAVAREGESGWRRARR